jgi:hypothetical protein
MIPEATRFIWPLPPEQVRELILSEMEGVISLDFLRICNAGKPVTRRVGIDQIIGAGIETTFRLTAIEAARAPDQIKFGIWHSLDGSVVPDEMRVRIRFDKDNKKFKVVFYKGKESDVTQKFELDERLCGPSRPMEASVAAVKIIRGDDDAREPNSQEAATLAYGCWQYIKSILQARSAS